MQPQVVTIQVLVHLEITEFALEVVVGQEVLLQQLLAGERETAGLAAVAGAVVRLGRRGGWRVDDS